MFKHKYENDLKEFEVLRFDIAKPKTGRPLDFAKLNEEFTNEFGIIAIQSRKSKNS
jgi:hypothetical protein